MIKYIDLKSTALGLHAQSYNHYSLELSWECPHIASLPLTHPVVITVLGFASLRPTVLVHPHLSQHSLIAQEGPAHRTVVLWLLQISSVSTKVPFLGVSV